MAVKMTGVNVLISVSLEILLTQLKTYLPYTTIELFASFLEIAGKITVALKFQAEYCFISDIFVRSDFMSSSQWNG